MKSIKQTIISSPGVRDLIAEAKRKGPGASTEASGVSGSLTSFLAAAAYEAFSAGALLIAPDDETAEKLRDDCAALAGAGRVKFFGARPLRYVIQQEIDNPLSKMILKKEIAEGDQLTCTFDGGKFVFRKFG